MMLCEGKKWGKTSRQASEGGGESVKRENVRLLDPKKREGEINVSTNARTDQDYMCGVLTGGRFRVRNIRYLQNRKTKRKSQRGYCVKHEREGRGSTMEMGEM